MGKHGQRALPLGHEHPEKDSTIKKKFCLPAVVRDLPLLVRSSSAPSSLAKLVSHIQTFSIAVKKKTKERKYKKSRFLFLPKASNKNSANSHEKNHNERHIKALLFIRRAEEKFQ